MATRYVGHVLRWSVALMVVLFLLGVVPACASKKAVNLAEYTDQQLFQEGMKLMEEEKWSEARERFRFLARIHLQSPFREQAYLKIADTYFHEGSAAMNFAVDAYQEFLRLYPNSPDAPYALFQIGELYFRRAKKPLRTQEFTLKAVDFYKQVIERFPNSEYATRAEERLRECYRRLCLHEFEIGKFYYDRDNYLAALWRFQYVLEHYPERYVPPQVFLYMAKTLNHFGRTEESLAYLRKLESMYPNTKWATEARKLRERLERIREGTNPGKSG